MSVQAWKIYNKAKKYISGTIALGSATFDLHFFTSASNFATATLSTLGSLTNQVASANGYTLAGIALTSVTWSDGASAGQKKFTSAAAQLSANGGTIANIKGAVIIARTGTSAKATANKVLAYCSLSSGQFSLADTNRLTLTPNASGIFTLT
jgi:hypothetical protein